MTDRSAEHWYPTAAYLYVLHLDGPALAWEYLRRNPNYRRDWLRRRRRPDAAQRPATRSPCLRVLARSWPQATDPRWQAPGAGVALARLLPAARARAGPGRRHGLPLRHPRVRHALRALSHPRGRAGCTVGRSRRHACGGGALPAHTGRSARTAHLAGARRHPGGGVLARGGRRLVRRGCRRGRLAQGQRFACPCAAAGAAWRRVDARRLSQSGAASASRIAVRGDVLQSLQFVP